MTLDKLPGTTREEYKRWERRERKREERERESKRVEVTGKKKKSKGAGRSGKKEKEKKKSRVNTNYTVRYGTIRQMFVGGKRSRIGKGSVDSFYSRVEY